jgi:hypothetical protein
MLVIMILCWSSLLPDRDLGDFVPSHKYPGVCLADGLEFPVDAASAKAHWLESTSYINRQDGYMQTFYFPKAYQLWRSEAEWARECWNQLDNFHRASPTSVWWNETEEASRRERKLYALWKLKEVLGEEAYNARLMPTTVVTWLK